MNEAAYLELTQQDPRAVSQLLVQKDLLIRAHEQEILKLQQHLINANKARFGRKSEKLSDNAAQGLLFEIEEPTEVKAEPDKTITVPKHSRAPRKARAIPEGTPIKVVNHAPAETKCSCCGNDLEQIRTEESRIVDYVPAHFEVTRHIKPVMACKHCKDQAPITTKLPSGVQLIERSSVGAGLLSHILISKYQDHQPLYRLEGIFARHGFEVPRQRMCDWLAKVAELLQPLYVALKKELLKQKYLQADETTVDVLDEDVKNKCHTGYFWGILAPPEINLVLFHYADSRASEVPKSLLSDFTGVLQTDLYAGYNEVYVPDKAIRAGCWAHVRRKFIDVQKLAPAKDVSNVLNLIADMYRAEAQLKDRQKVIAPIVSKIFEYISNWSSRTLPNSDVQKPLQYALKQRDALSLFLTNTHIKLDNNLIENQMRPIALGRKNWLFAGSHEGAMRAAIFFSFINSCRLRKINTWHYFNDILPKLAKGHAPLASLLPHNWKA